MNKLTIDKDKLQSEFNELSTILSKYQALAVKSFIDAIIIVEDEPLDIPDEAQEY